MKKYSRARLHRRCGRLVLMSLCAFVVFAANGQTLSLYDAVNKTIENYPEIKRQEQELKASQAHVTTVAGNMLPSLRLMDEVNVASANSLPGSYLPLSVIPSTSGAVRAENNGQAASGNIAMSLLEWELYNFGYKQAEKSAANAQMQVSKANLSANKYILSEQVIALYLDWLKKFRLLQIERENLDRVSVAFNIIRATVISGLKPGVDSSTASAQYAQSRIAYLQAYTDYKNEQITLATYTGLDTAAVKPDTAAVSLMLKAYPQAWNISDSVTDAHPVLNVYEKQYEEQLARNKATDRKYMPKLSLESAAWARGSSINNVDQYADLQQGFGYSRYNYLVGLAVSYNLFDIKHRHDEHQENNFRSQAKEEALKTAELNLNKALQQANVAYQNTLDKLNELPVQLHSATDAYNQQLALYKSGLNTLIDLTNAQYVLKQAETNFVITQDELLQLLHTRAGLSNQLDLFLEKFKS